MFRLGLARGFAIQCARRASHLAAKRGHKSGGGVVAEVRRYGCHGGAGDQLRGGAALQAGCATPIGAPGKQLRKPQRARSVGKSPILQAPASYTLSGCSCDSCDLQLLRPGADLDES